MVLPEGRRISVRSRSARLFHITGPGHKGEGWRRNMLKISMAFVGAILFVSQEAPRVFTIQELFTRNVGSTEQQNKQFPPHKIIGNVYYVGTESLSSFLVTTPQGHILINSIYERNIPTIQDSVQK